MLLLLLAVQVAAHAFSSTEFSLAGPNSSTAYCNRYLTNANATGVFSFAVDFPLNSSYPTESLDLHVRDPSWAVTVNSDASGGSISRDLWYSTAGQNYSNDLQLNYDVCAYTISLLPRILSTGSK
jgi:hypothetical protein